MPTLKTTTTTEWHKKKGYVYWAVVGARSRAKKRGLPFDITYEDVVVPEFCPILGIPLKEKGRPGWSDNSPSLDRIIPEKGYVKGNVRVISNRANRIKIDATIEELELVLADLRTHLVEAYP